MHAQQSESNGETVTSCRETRNRQTNIETLRIVCSLCRLRAVLKERKIYKSLAFSEKYGQTLITNTVEKKRKKKERRRKELNHANVIKKSNSEKSDQNESL